MQSLYNRISHNRNRGRDFLAKVFANCISSEGANNDVFAKLGNLRGYQIFDRLIRVLDKGLIQETNAAVKFVELTVDDFLDNILRLAFDLRAVDLTLFFDQLRRHLLTAYVRRMRRRDMQRQIFNKLTKIFVLGDKIGFAIHFNQHTNSSLQMDIGSNETVLCGTAGFLRRARNAFLAENLLCFFEVSAGFDERLLTIHHSCVGFFTQFLDERWAYLSHSIECKL